MVDLEAFPAEPASDALRAAPGACHPIMNPATLASDDRALAERLAGDLLPCGITLTQVPLTGQADVGPLRLTGGEPVLVDLGRRADRALAAIERARLGSAQRVVLALYEPQDVASAQQALDTGADDFCLRSAPGWEVHTRLTRLIAQRAPSADAAVLVVGDLELDTQSRSVRRRGQRLTLSSRQFELLRVLMRHAGEILSQARLMAELGIPQDGQPRASNLIEVHVYHLRRQIGDGRLSTVRGRGYVLHATGSSGN
ncbi:MAG: response regulator transcription factor [Burkholderiaceae bacterium]|nr:response regulator transcription factor [Burkholderiaceae bacterium]